MNRILTAFFLAVLACFSSHPVQAETGITANEITVGMSTVLTGPASFLGTNFKAGAEAYIHMVNASGGINGRKIRLIAYDDGYEPDKAVANVNKLLKEDKVFCLLGNVGTPTVMAIKPILAAEKVPLFAPFTGAESLRNPVIKHILNYRASYNQEVEAFIHGMVDVLGQRKIAVFYQEDAYGMAVLDAAKTALKKRKLAPVATGTYTRNFEDVSGGLDKIMAAMPEAVVMAGTYSACAKFITSWKRKTAGEKKSGQDPIFMNVSFVGPEKLAELLGKYSENVVVTEVVPPYYTYLGGARYPAVGEYLAAMQKYSPAAGSSFVSLEGFLAAKVFVEILKRAGNSPTRESFIQAAEGIKEFDIQAGNRISFSNQNHQGSQMVYPTVIRKNTFYLINDWKVLK
jgi:ABC-type branched-subunit amino acid transport system substrate-binding protein